MNCARYFMRREDYQEPATPADSPLRQFIVQCLKCKTYRVRMVTQQDEPSGETQVFLYCPRCRIREQLPMR